MKKLFSLLLCVLFIIGLAACTDKDSTPAVSETNPTGATNPAVETLPEDAVQLDVPNSKSVAESVNIGEPRFGNCIVAYEFSKLNIDIPKISKSLVELKDIDITSTEAFEIKGTEIAKSFNELFNYDFNFESKTVVDNAIWASEGSNSNGIMFKTNDNLYSIVVEDIKGGVSCVYIETSDFMKTREDVLLELNKVDNILGTDFSKDSEFIKIINSLSYTYDMTQTDSKNYNSIIILLWDKSLNRNIAFEIYGKNIDGKCYYQMRYGYEVSDVLYKDIKNGTFAY